jgi:transcriptional regulator with XRE-family HTH domain
MKKSFTVFGHIITIEKKQETQTCYAPQSNLDLSQPPQGDQRTGYHTAFSIEIMLRNCQYRYPYQQVAKELGVTRQAVWRVLNGEARSKRIENFVAYFLNLPNENLFPVKPSTNEVA